MDEYVKTSIDRARRKLFANEKDSENGEEENFCNHIREENRRRAEENMKKWNFDFERGVPLPGNFEWKKLDEHGNEISDSTNVINEEQNRNEQEEQTEKNARKNDESMDETAAKRAKLETS